MPIRNFIECVNNCCDESDINVIANADIYFTERLPNIDKQKCFALTRYDILADGSAKFLNRKDSNDTLIFRGTIRYPKYSDFWWGCPGADNRACYEFKQIGYDVSNPSISIKTYHIHAGNKSYDGSKRVTRPFHFILPTEL